MKFDELPLSPFERDQQQILELNRRALQQKDRLAAIKARQAEQIEAAESLLSRERAFEPSREESNLEAG